MAGDFHESYEGGAIEPPSERSTGLVFAAVALIVAILKRNSPTVPWVALGTGLMFVAVSLAAPVPQATEYSLVQVRAAPAPGGEPTRDVCHFFCGVRARRHYHAYLSRPA